MDHPGVNSTSRTFIAELHSSTWDRKSKQCLYVGSAQSGAINEVDGPNDHVIEGTYDNYEVSGLFDSDFQYNQFQVDQCAWKIMEINYIAMCVNLNAAFRL